MRCHPLALRVLCLDFIHPSIFFRVAGSWGPHIQISPSSDTSFSATRWVPRCSWDHWGGIVTPVCLESPPGGIWPEHHPKESSRGVWYTCLSHLHWHRPGSLPMGTTFQQVHYTIIHYTSRPGRLADELTSTSLTESCLQCQLWSSFNGSPAPSGWVCGH